MSFHSLIRKAIPTPVLSAYHLGLARLASVVYGHPSRSMIVIGVTGTNGKSSTVNFIAQILTTLGHKVGYTSTAGFNIAGKEIVNAMKMTMPGRFVLQRMLRDMVNAGCEYAIVETSSQGIVQHRHIGINYDVALFTNLTPEHIESHGGFEKYKAAKGKLFAYLGTCKTKHLGGLDIPKVNVVNHDDPHAEYFANFPADRHMSFGFRGTPDVNRLVASVQGASARGVALQVNGTRVTLPLVATFEHKNALAAIAAVVAAGIPLHDALCAVQTIRPVAGRFETIRGTQPFTVIVDYAYEPFALLALFDSLPAHSGKVIGVHGSAGGGRDVARRREIGRVAALNEDVVIVTNEDPYEEDPRAIIDAVAQGARDHGKEDGKTLYTFDERGDAIRFALASAKEGDVVLITGKGSEPGIMGKHGLIPWDDRKAAREGLVDLGYSV